MALVLQIPTTASASGLSTLRRDPLLDGDNSGVRFAFDLAFPWCYVGGAPANSALVKDVAEIASGSVVLASGQTISSAGNGFDFSAITASLSYLAVPANVASDIYNQTSGNQYFLAATYVKLPSQADWNATGSVAPFFTWGTGSGDYSSSASLCMMAQQTGGVLSARRQTSVGAVAQLSITVPTSDYGQVAQIAIWRNGTEYAMRLKTANNTTKSSTSVGSANSADFSATVGKFGIGQGFAHNTISGSTTYQKWRLYRGWVENLVRSGRDPETVLNADWTRTASRAVFS